MVKTTVVVVHDHESDAHGGHSHETRAHEPSTQEAVFSVVEMMHVDYGVRDTAGELLG